MTKKEAAFQLINLARSIHGSLAGDEGAEVWVFSLLSLARNLHPGIEQHPSYLKLLFAEDESTQTKLRRLIEHPATPPIEREAAVAALARVRAAANG